MISETILDGIDAVLNGGLKSACQDDKKSLPKINIAFSILMAVAFILIVILIIGVVLVSNHNNIGIALILLSLLLLNIPLIKIISDLRNHRQLRLNE